MKAPEKWSPQIYGHWAFFQPTVKIPATPTVYPVDDEVKEGLLGSDGKPLAEGTKRKNPIGFHRQQVDQ